MPSDQLQLDSRSTPSSGLYLVTAMAVIAGITFLGLLLPWEAGGESWGYWFFAKLLTEGDGFVMSDRGPIYTLYLFPFLSIPYPLTMAVESFLTTFLCALALTVFLRERLGMAMATFFSVIWIPFFQQNEPSTQALALACLCVALALRYSLLSSAPRHLAVSYALLILAILFRPNFGVFIIFILAYDYYQNQTLHGKWNSLFKTIKPLVSKSSLAIAALVIAFSIFPAHHRWNNAWLASTNWFPQSGQSLGTTSIIGHYNWRYIEKKYGSFEGRDIYFTHQEAFNGATTIGGMIRANPRLFAEIVATNAKNFFPTVTFSLLLPQTTKSMVNGVMAVLAFFVLMYGALRASQDGLMRGFVIASLITVFATSLSYPKTRYLFPFIPVIALSAWWYGKRIESVISRVRFGAIATLGTKIAVPVSLLIFSWHPLCEWAKMNQGKGVVGAETLQSSRAVSMRAAFRDLTRYSADCHGIMSLEHNFFAAFVVDAKRTAVYDVWEIPPFGQFGASQYTGLNPARVDCLFISTNMEQSVGMGTNVRLRFDNYLKPYEAYLLARGGVSIAIPFYGRVVKIQGKISE